MTYVDGFVIAIPKANRAAYKKMAKEASKVWKQFGALEYKECRADDMTPPQVTLTFPKLTKLKPEEEVWFSYIVYASKKDRIAVNKKVMAFFNEKYKDKKDVPMPFDMKRLAYGGFVTEVEA